MKAQDTSEGSGAVFEPHVDGHYLGVDLKGGRFSIIFETDGKRVMSFRAGKAEEVG